MKQLLRLISFSFAYMAFGLVALGLSVRSLSPKSPMHGRGPNHVIAPKELTARDLRDELIASSSLLAKRRQTRAHIPGAYPNPTQKPYGDDNEPMSVPADPGGCCNGDPVNLATGQETIAPPPDLNVYNPTGPSVSLSRVYGSQRVNANVGYWNQTDFGPEWAQSYDMTVMDEYVREMPQLIPGAGGPVNVSVTGNNSPDVSPCNSSGNCSWQILNSAGGNVANSMSGDSGGWNIVGAPGTTLISLTAPSSAAAGNYTICWTDGAPYSGSFEVPTEGTVNAGAEGYVATTSYSGSITYDGVSYTWLIYSGSGTSGTPIATYNANSGPSVTNGWELPNVTSSSASVEVPRNVSPGTYTFLATGTSGNEKATFTVAAEQLTLNSGASAQKILQMPNGSQATITAPSVPTSTSPSVICTVNAGAPVYVQWLYNSVYAAGVYYITFRDGSVWEFLPTARPSLVLM